MKLEGARSEGVGNDPAFHLGGGGPSGPGEIGKKFERKTSIERAAAEQGTGPTVDALRVDGDGNGKIFGGEFAEGDLIGEERRDHIFGTFSLGILPKAEVEVAPKVEDGEIVVRIFEIGGRNGEAGGKLKLSKVAEL